jgi:hypothetical protein
VKLSLFTFAEYAANTQDNKLVIAGTFNSLKIKRSRPANPNQPGIYPLPMVYLAAVVHASLSEGLTHTAELKVVNDDGATVLATTLGPMNFVMNSHGRPLQFQAVISVPGLPLPGPGEYSFEYWVDGQRLGETALYIDEVQGP